MYKLQKQMIDLVRFQGTETKKYIDTKFVKFSEIDTFNIEGLKKTINEIETAITSDEDTFKVISGLIDTNKVKLKDIDNEMKLMKKENISLINEMKDDFKSSNRDVKECRRVVEDELVLNISELNDVFFNSLYATKVDDSL